MSEVMDRPAAAPLTVSYIAIDKIHPDPENHRKVSASEEENEALRTSIEEAGIRVPLRVRPSPEHGEGYYQIIYGERRWTQARALGWMTEVPCIVDLDASDDNAATTQAVENSVRADLHPVDAWRTISKLTDKGLTLESAARSLGISMRHAKRLSLLGSLHPALIEALRNQPNLPNPRLLATIASAPQDVQKAAFDKAKGDWHDIAEDCTIERIPREYAVFDVETAGVVFEQDLFAEPGSLVEWVTRDVDGFMAAQRAALQAEAAASKGRIEVVGYEGYEPVIPRGWARDYGGIPKQWKKADPRKVLVAIAAGYNRGTVVRCLIKPTVDRPAATGNAPDVREATPPAREPITAEGRKILGAVKTVALRTRIRELPPETDVLPFLLLALTGLNVTVHGDEEWASRNTSFNDIARELVEADGSLRRVSQEKLHELACEALARIVVADRPNRFDTSGPAAEWIGKAIGADETMPRLDNPAFLGTVNVATLQAAAASVGIDKPAKTGKGLREQLAGRAERWSPVSFGAPGPVVRQVVDDADDADDDTQDDVSADPDDTDE